MCKADERTPKKQIWLGGIFLGANFDAIETARHFGVDKNGEVSYRSDHEGTRLNYEVISDAVSQLRCQAALSDDWKERIEEDVRRRS